MYKCIAALLLMSLFACSISAAEDINDVIAKAVEANKKVPCGGVSAWEGRSALYGNLILMAKYGERNYGDVNIGSAVPMINAGSGKDYHPWYFRLKSNNERHLLLAYLRYLDKKPFRAWLVPEHELQSLSPRVMMKEEWGSYWLYVTLDPANVPSVLSRYELSGADLP